jgi:hypothetical protein
MRHVVVLVGTLAFVSHAWATDPKAKNKPKNSAADPKAAVVVAKRAFRTAVQLCDVPGRCEMGSRSVQSEYLTMLQDTEKGFLQACERCSTSERCEAERQRIRDGKRSMGATPCE